MRYPPRIRAGTRIAEPVSTVGVAATVLDLVAAAEAGEGAAAAPAGAGTRPGREHGSLLGGAPPRALYAAASRVTLADLEGVLRDEFRAEPFARFPEKLEALRSDGWKLIQASDGRSELYRVAEDPGETRDLAARHPEVVDALRAELIAFRSQAPSGLGTAPPADPTAEEALRALGYAD
jgi:arylsulfatase A-like enzyme